MTLFTTMTIALFGIHRALRMICYIQGLKYKSQGGGTVQLIGPLVYDVVEKNIDSSSKSNPLASSSKKYLKKSTNI